MDQEFINQLAEKLSKLGTKRPLGFHYAHPFGTVPPDSIQCNGAEYNRALYADFFAYATEQGWVKTETEWQSIASQNNGYCSYYSDGDGSTTFRTPKFAPFMQVAITSGNVGNYHKAGLPALTGTLDASESSTKYGNSDTVQPESNEWMICVVVFGVATNVGSADVGNVMSAVAQVQGDVSSKLPNSTPHIVDTWKSGESWYRKWSDGFIEQGGEFTVSSSYQPITLTTPFSKGQYSVFATSYNTQQVYTCATRNHNLTSFEMKSSGTPTMRWMAVGY